MMPKKQEQSGFTLVEIIVSLSILFIIFSLLMIEIDALSISKKQRYEFIASQVANNEMESLRDTDFTSLPSSGTVSDPLLSQIPSGAGSFTVADYPSYSGLKELSVIITWNDGTAKSLSISSLVSSQGINQ